MSCLIWALADIRGGMFAFGGTAILICVRSIDNGQQIESQLLQSNYEGLLK